jgi:protein-disulfide isomerase
VAQNQRKGKGSQGSSSTAFYSVLGVIALAGVAAIGYAMMGGSGNAATELVEIDAPDVRALYELAVPVRLGPENAPVKVVEFGDFQCPGCGQFSLQTRPVIAERYVATGQVQFVFYDFPLVSIHDKAVLAARAARCAGDQPAPAGGSDETAYWIYHDKLFQEQGAWAYKQGSVVGDFVDYADQLGLDAGAFGSCLESDRFADVVTANRQLGDQLRIASTPTILVNNRRLGFPNALELSEAIEQALGTGTPTEGQ